MELRNRSSPGGVQAYLPESDAYWGSADDSACQVPDFYHATQLPLPARPDQLPARTCECEPHVLRLTRRDVLYAGGQQNHSRGLRQEPFGGATGTGRETRTATHAHDQVHLCIADCSLLDLRKVTRDADVAARACASHRRLCVGGLRCDRQQRLWQYLGDTTEARRDVRRTGVRVDIPSQDRSDIPRPESGAELRMRSEWKAIVNGCRSF